MTTRAERLAQYLNVELQQWAPIPATQRANIVASLLAIADDRTFLSLTDVSNLTGRRITTVKHWLDRKPGTKVYARTVEPILPAYRTAMGPLFDLEQVQAWMTRNPSQVQAVTS